jgi:phospholipid-transporting ATPase
MSRDIAVVVGGNNLTKIMKEGKNNEKLCNAFMQLNDFAAVVLACRVSPKQKAQIVTLVRNNKNNVTTLAIGDGANDVNMITAAHVGVGISGLEGQQAPRAADYSIGQFRFLKNLLFVHGREAYRRNSFLVIYMFYKNILLVIPVWWFGAYSLFSGT